MKTRNILLWITIFSISMAFLESAVVVYIRELLYPEGFAFPLAEMKPSLAITEIFREAATIVMLVGAGVLAGRSFTTRFAWFIFCFAIWDIFYYVFLKLLIGWPASLMDWDVLFMIPVTWTGPVLSPLIVSLFMIVFAGVIIYYNEKGIRTVISRLEWLLLIGGSIILVIAFTWDYSVFILEHYSLGDLINLPSAEPLFALALKYVPRKFNWLLFTAGSLPILSAIVLLQYRLKKA